MSVGHVGCGEWVNGEYKLEVLSVFTFENFSITEDKNILSYDKLSCGNIIGHNLVTCHSAELTVPHDHVHINVKRLMTVC